jgi:hypothetical protein
MLAAVGSAGHQQIGQQGPRLVARHINRVAIPADLDRTQEVYEEGHFWPPSVADE